MAGIKDLIDVFRGETINLNPFKTRSSAVMNEFGKLLTGKYATTSADEAASYASRGFPNVIKTTKITPKEFKIGRKVFTEIEPDFSGEKKFKRIVSKGKNLASRISEARGYNILSSKNKKNLKVDVAKTIASNVKSLTPLAMKGLNVLTSLPIATLTAFLQSTPANSDEVNMTLEDFAKLREMEGMMDKSLPSEPRDI